VRALAIFVAGLAWCGGASAQTTDERQPFGPVVDDGGIFAHVIVDQLEARVAGGDAGFRWDAEAWAGPDAWRVWLKSEGDRGKSGELTDGQTEAMVSRPIAPFWDVQVGARYDLDSRPGRAWGAIGVQGLAPGNFDIEATAYGGEKGAAAKLKASHDFLITNRLILQPEAELNAYSQDDKARLIGSGISDLDAGVRLRYEITRKFAPYVGVTWAKDFGRTASLMRAAGEDTDEVRLAVGLRGWF
jgi:copper resistance protein B